MSHHIFEVIGFRVIFVGYAIMGVAGLLMVFTRSLRFADSFYKAAVAGAAVVIVGLIMLTISSF